MTETRRALMTRLVRIQNTGDFVNQDIVTITGFMTDEEMERHVERYETLAGKE